MSSVKNISIVVRTSYYLIHLARFKIFRHTKTAALFRIELRLPIQLDNEAAENLFTRLNLDQRISFYAIHIICNNGITTNLGSKRFFIHKIRLNGQHFCYIITVKNANEQ